jgi:hypothetical protein
MMNRISKILIAAATVASTAGAASAQSFSGAWGTGNVQPTHDVSGRLVLDNAQQNNGGLSAFAAVPVGNASAITHDFIPVAILVIALFALLALSVWFAAYAWTHLGGDPVPTYGYVALAGGVVISLVVGGGLMALVFYSSRHGYDDLSGGDN